MTKIHVDSQGVSTLLLRTCCTIKTVNSNGFVTLRWIMPIDQYIPTRKVEAMKCLPLNYCWQFTIRSPNENNFICTSYHTPVSWVICFVQVVVEIILSKFHQKFHIPTCTFLAHWLTSICQNEISCGAFNQCLAWRNPGGTVSQMCV